MRTLHQRREDIARDLFVQLLQPGPQIALPIARAQGHWVQSQILAQISQDRQDQALLQHRGAFWTCKLAAAYELKLKFELCL